MRREGVARELASASDVDLRGSEQFGVAGRRREEAGAISEIMHRVPVMPT